MWLQVSNQAGSVDPPLTEGFLLVQSEISAELIAAYRATHYRVGQGANAFTLRVDVPSETLSRLCIASGHQNALFITAYNPFSQTQSNAANLDAHERLRDILGSQAGMVIESAGADPSGAWPEEKSFLALGVDLVASKRLGIQFGQNAIVWAGEDAVPRLILLR